MITKEEKKEWSFGDVSITFLPRDMIQIRTAEEICLLTPKAKQVFANKLGEEVIELSGRSSEDRREDRSWALASFAEEGMSKLHYHTAREEIYYVTRGIAIITLDGRESTVHVGEQITIPAGKSHKVVGRNHLEMIVKCTPAWVPEDQHFLEADEELATSVAMRF